MKAGLIVRPVRAEMLDSDRRSLNDKQNPAPSLVSPKDHLMTTITSQGRGHRQSRLDPAALGPQQLKKLSLEALMRVELATVTTAKKEEKATAAHGAPFCRNL